MMRSALRCPRALAGRSRGRSSVLSAGFTLIELMVTVSLLGLVTVASGTILLQANRARDRVNAAEAAYTEADRALRDVANALRNRLRMTEEDDPVVFEGISSAMGQTPADRVRFFTVDPRRVRFGQPESDVKEVEFALVVDELTQRPTLLKRTDPTRNLEPDGGGVLDRIAELMAFDVSYFDGLIWRDDWPVEIAAYPAAVRVRISVLDASRNRPIHLSRLVTWPYGQGGDVSGAFEALGPGQSVNEDDRSPEDGF